MINFYQDFTIGVLGGGQLGRMLIQSAIDLNLDIAILDPDPNAPCKHIAKIFEVGSLKDTKTVYEFGIKCDLITIEIENIDIKALEQLQKEGKIIYPQPAIIALIQDKRKQKQFYLDHQIPTASFLLVENKQDVIKNRHLLPAVNKLGKDGYDGRGVQLLRTEDDLSKAFDAPGLIETLVDFKKEISIIVAKNKDGEIKTYPAVELVFHPEQNLVEYLISPADISSEVESQAKQIAKKIITDLDMVGLLAVEMFVTHDDEILVNEIAPRTHNSGHQSIEGNVTSQFEQHLRAILNLPLGATNMKTPSAMVNLLGEEACTGLAKYDGLEEVLKIPGVHVHLYGKKLTKPFRKMGHVTIIDESVDQLKAKMKIVKSKLKVIT